MSMKINYPGLLRERMASGAYRWRVRVRGDKARRIRLHVDPEHPGFREHYMAARQGIELKPEAPPDQAHIRGSLGWLIAKHLDALARDVEAGQKSPKTLIQRRHILGGIAAAHGEYAMVMPRAEVIKIRDGLSDRPAQADKTVQALRVLYRWAEERGIVADNPAIGVRNIDKGRGGAVPWSIEDLDKYRRHHGPGTMAHLALTLLVFTACRIGDARVLGRRHEFSDGGVRMLGWQPGKAGSARVEIPMLPQLHRATRAMTIMGPTYLLTSRGRPFASADAMGTRFRRWCDEAGLSGRSAHGIRKAAGHLLAEAGCTQHQIMAIHGHTEARTSEVYTRGVDRRRLAVEAMKVMEGLEW